jgi:hypothetical protein
VTEVGELIASPRGHTKPNEKCPFCPPKARKGYKTYPGASNNSSKLEKIMEEPSCLTSQQSGARPQTEAEDDGWVIEQEPPDPRTRDRRLWHTFQAHHLISGKQAMEGEPIEDWIKASSKNEKDTGYSINGTNNGFWAPSTPKRHVGRWGPGKGLTDDQRQDWAEKVMSGFGAQIHIGPHNIADPDDPRGDKHASYDRYLKGKLEAISDRVSVWANKCKCPPKKKPPQATHHLHDSLDRLSTHMQGQVSGSRASWQVFLSKYALEYHRPVCPHKRKKKGRR